VAVKRIWDKPCRDKSTLDKIQQKLKLIKQYFKGWGFNLQGELKKKRKEISEELVKLEALEEDGELNDELYLRKMCLIKGNLSLLDQETY
jgi:hypothetical protein